ncbi:hypothetical protein F4861DRAFT_507677 [Xylaria intraflava]|nr:hypothetical protein F4861DRAFT_507677 [Xylaria intraflava]
MPEPQTAIDPAVMSHLRLWHLRMGHAHLKAIVVVVRQGRNVGEIPAGFPKGPREGFEGLQPYLEQFNCDSCRRIYGNPSGPTSW